MPFDREAAKKAGYSDQEIDEYLGQKTSAPTPAPAAAPAKSLGGFLGNAGNDALSIVKGLPNLAKLVFTPTHAYEAARNAKNVFIDGERIEDQRTTGGDFARGLASDVASMVSNPIDYIYNKPVSTALTAAPIVGKAAGAAGVGAKSAGVGSKAAGAAKVSKSASEGNAVGNFFKGTAKKTMDSAFKEPVPETQLNVKRNTTSVGDEMLKDKKAGSYEKVLREAQDEINILEDQLQSSLSTTGSGKFVSIKEIRKSAQPHIDRLRDAAKGSQAEELVRYLDEMESRHGEFVPVDKANVVKRTMYDDIGKKGYSDTRPSSVVEGEKAIAHSIMEQIEKQVPEAKSINQGINKQRRYIESSSKGEAHSQRNAMVGLLDTATQAATLPAAIAMGNPLPLAYPAARMLLGNEVGKSHIAQGLNKAGDAINNLSAPSLSLGMPSGASSGSLGATGMAQGQLDQTYSFDGGDPISSTGDVLSNPTPAPQLDMMNSQPQSQKPFFNEQVMMQLIASDLAETGGKNVEMIQEVAKMFGYGGQEQKKLTGTQAQRASLAQTALNSLDQIEGQMADTSLWQRKNPLDQSGRRIDADISSAIDTLGYLRTGATLTEEQAKTYRKLLPDFLDSPETAKYKMDRLREEFMRYANPDAAQPDLQAVPVGGY